MHQSDIDVEVQVLGRIAATVDGRQIDLGGPRQQALLAALASRVGRTVANDVIIDAVWDGDPPEGAASTFRSYVARLRRAFDKAGADGAAVVVTESAGYRLDDQVDVDADLFEAEVARARDHLAQGQLADAISCTEDALARWDGTAFGRFGGHLWAAPLSARLEELRLAATELRARALLDADRVPQAAALLEELAAAEPYREAAVRLQALALYRSGRDADAMRVVREFRTRLADEHGLDPSDQLAELESMVLNRDPRLDRPVAGRRLRGYVLHEPIAHSPLGTVHRAEQPSIGREVAVTVLPPHVADTPEVVRAFEARLQAVGGLAHPHLLPVYDHWREPGGAYVVTRLPAGTLGQALRAGRVTAAQTVAIGEQVAAALAAAHERGVVHGAVGPDAVVIDARGDAFLWGFPLTGEPAGPAADVAGLAEVLGSVAEHASDGSVATDSLPQQVRDVLDRARTGAGDRTVTAAGLAATLTAARSGALEPPVVPLDVGPNPYRGLAAFREADADVFFGRGVLVDQLVARLTRQRAVAVVGPSGSGKSSVVRAGVLPRLRGDGAFVTTMVPGTHPLAELEVALSRVAAVELADVADEVVGSPDGLTRLVRRVLPSPGGDLVLVVDQFEELFTQSDPTERDLVLTALTAAVDDADAPVRVVVTLRADFLGAALSHPTAGRLLRERCVMVTPLTDDELHDVIVRPAGVAGVAVDPALATAVVADAARAPGSLPMVQFALTEVFASAHDSGLMTLEAYRRIGGIEGVLGQRAEEVHAALDEMARPMARALFRRLVMPTRDGPPARRRALRSELEHVPGAVIDAFGDARLLLFDRDEESREPTVEVSHEALFRAWPRLAAWIEEEADDLRLLHHLTAAAVEWDGGGRADAELYRGGRLDSALDFAGRHRHALSAKEQAFLDAARDRRRRQAASSARTLRRLRLLTGGLAVGLVLALVGALVALDQRRQVQAEQRVAVARELAAASTAVADEDAELAVLLALEAVDRTRSVDGTVLREAESALHRAVTSSRSVLHVDGTGGSVAWHPDGSVFATEGPEESGLVDVRDTATGELVQSYVGHEIDINDVIFSPDGALLATTGDDGFLRVWDSEDGELRAEVEGQFDAWGVTFSPDGTLVAASWSREGTVRVLDLDDGGPPLEIDIATPPWGNSISFDPDGTRLAMASIDGVVIHDVVTGERVRRLNNTPFAEAVAWSPDGRWIASTSPDALPRITEAASGEVHVELDDHDSKVFGLDWSADASRLATVSIDGLARVFEVTADGAARRVEVGARDGALWGVDLSDDGELLLTGDSISTSTRVWAVGANGGAEWANLAISRAPPHSAASFSPGGDEVAVTGLDEAALVWSPDTGTRTRVGIDLRPATEVEVSPDGDLVATADAGDVVHVWDPGSGEEQFTVDVPGLVAEELAWHPDGGLLAITGDDLRAAGRIAITDRSGELVTVLEDGETDRSAVDVAFSADGRWLVSSRRPSSRNDPTLPSLRIWDWEREEVVADLPTFATVLAVDPAGTRIAAADQDGEVGLWDPQSQEQHASLVGHTGDVTGIAFSADGTRIATSSLDGTVRLWRADTGEVQLVLHGHDGPVHAVAFGPDGDRLVSTAPGLARIWALDIDDLTSIAARRVTRSLTDDECQQYLHVERCGMEAVTAAAPRRPSGHA